MCPRLLLSVYVPDVTSALVVVQFGGFALDSKTNVVVNICIEPAFERLRFSKWAKAITRGCCALPLASSTSQVTPRAR